MDALLIDAAVDVPVVANGEVWTVADWERCRAVSGCADVMIGRREVSDPFLALRIRGLMDRTPSGEEWPAVLAPTRRLPEKTASPCRSPS